MSNRRARLPGLARRASADPTLPRHPRNDRKNEIIVEAWDEQITRWTLRIPIPPYRSDFGMGRKQFNRRIHCLRKPQGSRGICITDVEGFVLEVPLKLLSLSYPSRRCPPTRAAIIRRTRSESFRVPGVEGQEKLISTSFWIQAIRSGRSSSATRLQY